MTKESSKLKTAAGLTLSVIGYKLAIMKALMLYRPNTEYARTVESYVRDFEKSQGKKIELVNLDTREGAATATLYDMPQQPSLLVVQTDGQLAAQWTGPNLPLMSEVASYLAA